MISRRLLRSGTSVTPSGLAGFGPVTERLAILARGGGGGAGAAT